jgi:hypothetical protein
VEIHYEKIEALINVIDRLKMKLNKKFIGGVIIMIAQLLERDELEILCAKSVKYDR